MDESPDRLQHLFVVRLWHEPSGIAPPGQWRGSVAHVASGQQLYFVALKDLNEFIRAQVRGRSESLPVVPDIP